MQGSASTQASVMACEPLACILAVKNVFCSSLLQLSLFLRGMETNIPRFTAYQQALEVLHKQSQEDAIQDKRHKSLMLSYPSHYSLEFNY